MSEISISPFNPLSAPRGMRVIDEITGSALVTLTAEIHGAKYYYASHDSLNSDWSVLQIVGKLMADIAAEQSATGTHEDTQAHLATARRLRLRLAAELKAMAEERLQRKDFEGANPACLRCLRVTAEIYGHDESPELVEPRLLLAESALGCGRLAQAEELLSTANFTLAKVEGAPDSLRARLQLDFGRVHMQKGNAAAATEAFAKAVYFAARSSGNPESIDTAPGYFHLGDSLEAQARLDAALACYDKVVDIWYKYLVGARSTVARALAPEPAHAAASAGASASAESKAHESKDGSAAAASHSHSHAGAGVSASSASSSSASSSSASSSLSEVVAAEAVEMLSRVTDTRNKVLGPSHIATAEATYTTALLHLKMANVTAALPLLQAAADKFSAAEGADSAGAEEVKELIAKIQAHA